MDPCFSPPCPLESPKGPFISNKKQEARHSNDCSPGGPGAAEEADYQGLRLSALMGQGAQGGPRAPHSALSTGDNATLRFLADFLCTGSHLSFLSVFKVVTMKW